MPGLRPSGRRRRRLHIWNLLSATLCIYYAISIPLRIAFVPDFALVDEGTRFLGYVIFDAIATFFCLWDALNIFFKVSSETRIVPVRKDINNQTEAKNKIQELDDGCGGASSRQRRRCRFHFRAFLSWPFLLSVLSSCPLEYLALLVSSSYSTNYLLLNRMLLFLKLPQHLSNVSIMLEEAGILRNIGIHRAWKLFFAMALAGHWCGCGFYLVAKRQAVIDGNPFTWPEQIGVYRVEDNLVDSDGATVVQMLVDTKVAYIQALYWAYITMITTGFGDIVPLSISETVWCIFSMYIGVVITTLAIANLQLLVTNMDAALSAFQRKTERVKMYMRYRQLPSQLANRIISFYDYKWDLLKGSDEEKFLQELPRSLQQQVANFMCRDLVASIPFLRKANNALLNALAESAEFNLCIYSPNDDILKPGERIKGALLISRGEMEVLNARGTIVERKLQSFDRYADECLFGEKQVCDRYVRAKTFCEVFLLPSHEFQQIIRYQCDDSLVAYMKETALALAKSSIKANKMFGSAEEAVVLHGFKRHCHPASTFRKIWSFLQLIGIVYYIWALPLSMLRFFRQTTFSDAAVLLTVGYIIDVFFLVNLVFTSSYFIYLEQGLVVFDAERIRKEFFRTHNKVLELLAALPVEVILAIPSVSSYHHVLRMTKLLRLPKILRYTDGVERVLAELKLGLNQSAARVFKLNFILIIVCHWIACLWYAMADFGIRVGTEDNWRDADEEDDTLAIDHDHLGGSGYLRSIYWAIVGCSTVGYGDIIPTNSFETTFAALVILFGGLVLPAVVGGLAAYLGNWNVASKTHRNKLARVRTYMRNANLDRGLVQRVLRFYDYLWSRQGGVDEQAVMDELPGPIRQRIAMHVNGSVIDSVPFFALCDDTAKQLIVSILKPKVYLPTDVIAQQGEVGTEMFLIERGQVLVSSQDGSIPYCTLAKGDYFGESCLLGATVRVATVTALTYCDCFVLSKDDYNDVMSTYLPPARRNIDNAVADAVHRKTRRNNSISRNITHFPKCRRQTVSETLAEVTMAMPGMMARYLPDSTFRTRWDVAVLICYAYNAWTIPFRLAFQTHPLYYIIDWSLDLLLIVDSLLNYRDFALVIEGELVTKRDQIKRNYVKTRLKTDFLSSLPLDAVTYALAVRYVNYQSNPTASTNMVVIMALLRLPKLLRLGRLPRVLNDIFRSLEDTRFGTSLAPIRLVEFLLGVILVAHWAGCGFFALARWKNDWSVCANILKESRESSTDIVDWADEYTECIWHDTWVQGQIMNGKLPATGGGGDLWQLYIRAFNWALPTLVVVVIGDVVPITSAETLYVFLWIVIGVSINATIIGNVANIVANLETDSTEFVERVDAIKSFMHRHHLGPDLQSRVEQFMVYLWATHGGVANDDDFIQSLPYTLQLDLTKSRQRHIRHCPFFDFCSEEIIKALTLCLKLRIFSANDVIIHANDMGQEMYFIERGSVKVMSRDGKTVFATLMSGCFFGETSLFFKQKRNSTIKAATFCEVYRLDKTDLDRELKQRDFDLSRMLDVFTGIAESNTRRNEAVAMNLEASRIEGSKLNKIIHAPSGDPLTAGSAISSGRKRIRRIFLPNSSFRAIWDVLLLVFTVYYAVSIPYRAAFVQEDPSERSHAWLVVDFAIDAYFCADVWLRSRSFAFVQNGSQIVDETSIFRHYLANGMIVDIVACLPMEILACWLGRPNLRYIRFLRIIHFVRVLRLPSYLAKMESYLTLWGVRVSAASILLLKMFFFYAMTNHWLACGWMIIHRYLERHYEYTWATTDCSGIGGSDDGCLATWDDDKGRHNVCSSDSMTICYTRAFYFVITTISTVGYGDIAPATALETIWENIVVLTGAGFFAGIIGAFSAWLSHSDTTGSNAYKLKIQQLREYMSCRQYPTQLQDEILTYHKHAWDQSHVLDKKKILQTLPLPLQMDLSYEVMRHVVAKIPLLDDYSLIVQKRISHSLTMQVCPPGSTIYSVGDIGFDIYFIGKGIVKINLPEDISVLDAAGKANAARNRRKQDAIGTLYRPGNHFGESCLTSESGVRQETAVSESSVELYLITKSKLDGICQYMSAAENESFKNALLRRNGTAWHSFGDEEEDEGISSTSEGPLSPLQSPIMSRQRSSRRRRRAAAGSLANTNSAFRDRLASFSASSLTSSLTANRGYTNSGGGGGGGDDDEDDDDEDDDEVRQGSNRSNGKWNIEIHRIHMLKFSS